jgi:hypothetical protein
VGRADSAATLEPLDNLFARRFRRSRHRGLAEPHPAGFLQQFRPLLEAVANDPAQTRQTHHCRAEALVTQADPLVPRREPFPTRAAVVVGPRTDDPAAEAEGVSGAVTVEAGSGVAMGAVDATSFVAVFF